MTPDTDRGLLLRQLKNYLVFLRDNGTRRVPLQSELLSLPIMGSRSLSFQDQIMTAKPSSGASAPSPQYGTPAEMLEKVRADLGDCTRCKLCNDRQNIVFGSGNPNARLVFVGEGPGADEDAQGLPFVGRAGKKLTEIIENGMKLDREKDTYICNIVKCRPPGNRDPEADEVAACQPFLVQQLRAIRPKVVVALGKPAASTLLGRSVAITKERGTWHEFEGIPLMLTFHPAYLLRAYTVENRRAVMDDMNQVLKALNK